MRNQTSKLRTGKGQRRALFMITILLCTAAAGMFYRAFIYKVPFTPPAYETNVRQGVPEPPDSLNFGSVAAPAGFSVGLCGTMYQQQDGSLLIYLTNPETSEANIRCEIKDMEENVLYQSGVLKPNEYVESLTPVSKLKNEAMDIQIFVYGYEPETWYSKGTIVLENVLQAY